MHTITEEALQLTISTSRASIVSHDVTVPTAAGVVTKTTIRKGKADGTYDYTTDSIVCRENAANEKTVTL